MDFLGVSFILSFSFPGWVIYLHKMRVRWSEIWEGEESYEGRHDGGGVAQALDGGVGPLLEVVVIARHVE